MKKIDKSTAETVIAKLEVFAKLERKNTDEVGWISLGFGCSRKQAASMIAQARVLTGKEK